jgi:hypothetical protein
MHRHPRGSSIGQRLALAVLALLSCLPPVWGERVRGLVAGRIGGDAPSCCLEPDRPSCCPENEGQQSGPALLPKCCAFDAPSKAPAPEAPPRLSVPDPGKRLLRELARALQHVRTLSPGDLGRLGSKLGVAGPSPPDAARGTRPPALHWLTDRESTAVLAILSIARL